MKWQDVLDSLIKDALEIPLRERGALEVLDGPDVLVDLHGLLVGDRHLLTLPQLLAHFGVVSQIELRAHEYDGHAGRVMLDFWVPLCAASMAESQRGLGMFHTFAFTLSNDEGLTMEKQMRKTSVWGYDSGRNRS